MHRNFFDAAAQKQTDYCARGGRWRRQRKLHELAKLFVNHVRDLTAGRKKVLMIFDSSHSHISLLSLTFLRESNTVAYAFPAHMSGKTQSLDVTLLGRFELKLN